MGLADQFGPGCEVVEVSGDEGTAEVCDRVTDLWHRADGVRPLLRVEATRQLELGEEAYAKVHELVDRRRQAGCEDDHPIRNVPTRRGHPLSTVVVEAGCGPMGRSRQLRSGVERTNADHR